MFIGPFEQMIPWDEKGIKGVRRFLEKVWRLRNKVGDKIGDGSKLEQIIHRTIKKVSEDIENLKFNTAISSLMTLVNEMEKQDEISMNYYSILVILLSPFAPHITEELWESLHKDGLCWGKDWPEYNHRLIKKKKISLIIQINGKVRGKIETDADISEKEAKKLALKQERIISWLKNKDIKKVVFVKGRLINFVV